MQAPTDPATLGYFAGLLDGEGNLQFKPRSDRQTIACKLAIYNTHPGVMVWLETNIGGHVRWDHKRVERDAGQPLGIWEVYRARDVEVLLRAALPYLIIKRQAAETALALFAAAYGPEGH